jgi:antitoxin component HigA of HigAB toxin-antitoxin module
VAKRPELGEGVAPDVVGNILRVMNAKGLTRADLGTDIATQNHLGRVFCRQRRLSATVLAKVADVLDVSVASLTNSDPK